MSPRKHTPGPWYFAPRMNMQSGLMIYAQPHGVTVAAVPHNDSTGRADAALIAAAPDLLEAARAAAKSHMMYGKVMQRDIDALINAIHKAQGGAA